MKNPFIVTREDGSTITVTGWGFMQPMSEAFDIEQCQGALALAEMPKSVRQSIEHRLEVLEGLKRKGYVIPIRNGVEVVFPCEHSGKSKVGTICRFCDKPEGAVIIKTEEGRIVGARIEKLRLKAHTKMNAPRTKRSFEDPSAATEQLDLLGATA